MGRACFEPTDSAVVVADEGRANDDQRLVPSHISNFFVFAKKEKKKNNFFRFHNRSEPLSQMNFEHILKAVFCNQITQS